MEQLIQRCAGIDVGQAESVVCVRVPDAVTGAPAELIASYGTITPDLLELVDWLRGLGVTDVSHRVHRGFLEALLPGGGRLRGVAGQRPPHQARSGAARRRNFGAIGIGMTILGDHLIPACQPRKTGGTPTMSTEPGAVPPPPPATTTTTTLAATQADATRNIHHVCAKDKRLTLGAVFL